LRVLDSRSLTAIEPGAAVEPLEVAGELLATT